MKRLLFLSLLITFTAYNFRGLWVISSFYLNRDYIAANVCVNRFDKIPVCKGQCFLDKELTKTEKKEQQQRPDIKWKEIQLFVANSISAEFPLEFRPITSSPNTDFLSNLPSTRVDRIFHPPCQA